MADTDILGRVEEIREALRICSGIISPSICAECPNYGTPKCGKAGSEAVSLIDAQLERIKELEAQSPAWVSVNDRLPEPGESVLVISHGWRNNHNDIYVAELTPMNADDDGTKNFWGVKTPGSKWTIWGWSYLKAPDVTHWIPLPKLPKEEAADDGQPPICPRCKSQCLIPAGEGEFTCGDCGWAGGGVK